MKLDRDKYLLEDEARRLLQAARSRFCGTRKRRHVHAARDYALLATGLNTGFRAIELVGLRVGDLRGVVGPSRNERPARVRVRRAKKRVETFDEVTLPETARAALAEYLGPLAQADKEAIARIFPISVRQVERLFKYYLKLAGLSSVYVPHSMRHTRAISLAERYRDPKLIQDALGHSSLVTTERYLHTIGLDQKLVDVDLAPTGDASGGEKHDGHAS